MKILVVRAISRAEIFIYLIKKTLDIIKSRCLVKTNTPVTGGRGWLKKPLWLLTEETKDYVCYRMSLYYYIELLQLLKSTNSGILFFLPNNIIFITLF